MPTARLNLGARAWRRLRELYGDQPVALRVDLQARCSGLWLSFLERLARRPAAGAAALPPPVFVIGHWRSGTTFLHELLCAATGFNFPSTYACMNPQVFPLTEQAVLRRSGQTAIQRPMDGMQVTLDSPQEDEFALLGLGARSPYEGLLFPRALPRAMACADPADLPEAEREEWIRVFTRFVSQVAARRPDLPVLLKSPTHSYRVRLLAGLFPGARFVHIVRNPYEVFASTMHMWRRLCALYSVSGPPEEEALAAQVLAGWLRLEEKLQAARPVLTAGRIASVRYEALVARPREEAARIFAELSLGDFGGARPAIERFLAGRAAFARNRFELPPARAHQVREAWQPIFDKYGYPAATLPA